MQDKSGQGWPEVRRRDRAQAVREIPEVRSLLSVSGEFDMIVVMRPNSAGLDSLITKLDE